ncbi:MAG TPA: iron ABC transporter permease [Ideonella sp.]|uniref:FecCD family ABC transporter permease n=1 Tax=Ideonella sp. TaxID=1929293 RepID=UPI002D1AACC5|nr:iron ABC transporter permease [Ideonella sp.]HSI51411.1 iron ABC transporter permease [Ideonella sp.]
MPSVPSPSSPALLDGPSALRPMSRGRAWRIGLVLAALLLLVFAVALASGSSLLSFDQVPRLLLWPDDSPAAEVLHRLRLPRALAAMSTGALLAMSGALMQVLLRNPLADPYVLGLSGAAALGALAMLALGCGLWAVQGGALVGALLAVAAVFFLGRHDMGRLDAGSSQDDTPRLLLTGVMISSIAMAGVGLILSLAPGERLRGMLFWMMGDLSGSELSGWLLALPVLLCAALLPWARDLNLLLRGPGPAQMLGVPVRRVRAMVYLAASLGAAVAVCTAGTIGFVGLVVPHALRLLFGNDQRLLLPASALAGAAFLLAADTLARTVAAPLQLPVGVVTSLIGAPTFIVLLARRGGRV